MDKLNAYIVVIDEEFTRDIQIARIPEAQKSDTENWDCYEGDVVVGIYLDENGIGKDGIIGQAAIDLGISGEQLKAYKLADYKIN